MKSAIAMFVLVAALGSTCALAQEGSAGGPPRAMSIIVTNPVPTTVPTSTPKLVQPKFR
jgi:hypothetical protein